MKHTNLFIKGLLPTLIALVLAACSTQPSTPPLPTEDPATEEAAPTVAATAAPEDTPAADDASQEAESSTPEVPADATPEGEAGDGSDAEATPVGDGGAVTFDTADGVTLSGTLLGDSGPGVVLVPSYPGEQEGWASFASEAAEAGYQALIVDLRGRGASGGERDLSLAADDVAAAVGWLRERGAEPVVVLAAGQSGIGAIQAAAQDDTLAGLGLLSTPRSVGDVSLADETLAALTVPALWLAARTDMAQAIEELSAAAGSSDSVLWIYEGSSLSGTYLFEGADQADVRQRLLQFIARVTGS